MDELVQQRKVGSSEAGAVAWPVQSPRADSATLGQRPSLLPHYRLACHKGRCGRNGPRRVVITVLVRQSVTIFICRTVVAV